MNGVNTEFFGRILKAVSKCFGDSGLTSEAFTRLAKLAADMEQTVRDDWQKQHDEAVDKAERRDS